MSMDKQLILEYYAVIDPRTKPRKNVISGDLVDAMAVSFNGIPVWKNLHLAHEQDINGGCTRQASVKFIPDETNSISIHNVQQIDGFQIILTSIIKMIPLGGSSWRCDYVYDFTRADKDDFDYILDKTMVSHEGYKFMFNGFEMDTVHECQAGRRYSKSSPITWNTEDELYWAFEETGLTKDDSVFCQLSKFILK